MPSFTVTLSQAAVDKLKAVVARDNANNGTALTVQDWLLLHLQEIAITDDLMGAVEGMRQQTEKQANTDLQAAIKAERERLLATL